MISNYETVNGCALDYIKSIDNIKNNITKKKRKVEIRKDNEGFSEENITEAKESWLKGRSSFANGKKQKPSYQNNFNLVKLETKSV